MKNSLYPIREITLHRRLQSNDVFDSERRLNWSFSDDGNFKTVEHAVLDYFSSENRFASRDVSVLMELMLTLQLVAANKLPKSIIKKILCTRQISKVFLEMLPLNLPFTSIGLYHENDIRYYLGRDEKLRNQIFQIFPTLNEDFSERDLVLTIIETIDQDFLSWRDFHAKVKNYVSDLKLKKTFSSSLNVDLALLAFFHYDGLTEKDVRSRRKRYQSRYSELDMKPLFDNAHLAKGSDIETLLPDALPVIFKCWQDFKIHDTSYGSKKYRGLISEIRKLEELSEQTFWGYLVHGSKSQQDVITGLTELYSSLPTSMWLNLARKSWSRPGDFKYMNGVPDLIVWDSNGCEFLEIKSPTDRMRASQIDYFTTVLEPLSLNFSVCNVTGGHASFDISAEV